MGKKLDAFLGRGFKTAKFKTLVNLAISRLAVLKNQRQVRCSQARSDVIQLLNLGHHERALLRVELIIKEQNMLDAFVMIEGYCHLLIERVLLIANDKECPDELKEAISTLIFSASRCGEFPELQEIRNLFISRYGREFASRAVELRNNCGVNPRIIQKFSTRQPSLEIRMKLLKEIASENGITLKLQEESSVTTEVEVNQKQNLSKHGDEIHQLTEAIERDKQFSESMKTRKQYRDVVSAAQAAFESAAYAAAAARAAVELSRGKSQDNDPDDPSSPLDEIHPAESLSSDSEDDEQGKNHREIHIKERKNKAELVRSMSATSSDSDEGTFEENKISPNQKPGESAYDASDDEIKSEEGTITIPWLSEERAFDKSDDEEVKIEEVISKHSQLGFNGKSSFGRNEFQRTQQSSLRSQDHLHKDLYTNKVVMGSGNEVDDPIPMAYPDKGRRSLMESKQSLYSEEHESAPRVNKGRKPVSVRTRRA
ncbi:uncharacterized protein LOC122665743 [Telopea speciosissima]|uniref:uncharacterized protein LOC122665743 n=1 Tax=Telopea speciosissima TaxID=54955 RepID=UPI001CC78033|nr:uncharacterized protein LOC122665743 [Telopea speciosissima]